jgi:fructose-specific component phosphotransferase system IIB-like protein
MRLSPGTPPLELLSVVLDQAAQHQGLAALDRHFRLDLAIVHGRVAADGRCAGRGVLLSVWSTSMKTRPPGFTRGVTFRVMPVSRNCT